MPQLKHTKIYRGGMTAPSLSFETGECSASADKRFDSLDLRFNLKSKGGGTTCVLLRIGKDDLHLVLQEIASTMPECVGMLSDCASIANKKNLELLEAARKVHDSEKARARSLAEDLELVEQFVRDKYLEAPAGADEKEERVKKQLQNVMWLLRELR